MYQEHFGFNRRPFAAVPDIGLFVENAANLSCLDAAIVCLESGQGIAILTAPAGIGKTIMCHKLAHSLKSPFVTVLLPNSNFASQRAMLQSVLFELGRKYVRLEEQELRLELISALRSFDHRDEKVVLIVDEAEHLKPEILEEIRNLANLSESGRPLVRVVLSGQPQLEERLLEPDMTALNQRIRSQLYLQPFTRAESLDYVVDQIQICGQIAELVIQEDALDLIVHAADGNARCLNQLADHSLLLSYMSGERPVSLKTVREALDDLKQLPLQWNDPGTLGAGSDESLIADEVSEPTGHVDDSNISETWSESNSGLEADFDEDHDCEDGVVSFEVGGADADIPTNDAFETNTESVPIEDVTYEQTDDDTAVFEVGAGDAGPADESSVMRSSDANALASEGCDDDDGVIELPADQDSYAAYQPCDPIRHEVDEAQGIASAFLDAEEFTDVYEMDAPSLTDDQSALEIPLVPMEYSTFESFDTTPNDGPTLSLVDRMDDDPERPFDDHETDTEQDHYIEELETFAEQAVGTPSCSSSEQGSENAAADEPYEEIVFDRYALLDAGGHPASAAGQDVVSVMLTDSDGDCVAGDCVADDCLTTERVAEESAAECAVEECAVEQSAANEDWSADDAGSSIDASSDIDEVDHYDVIMADPPMDELEPSIAVEANADIDRYVDLLDEEREMLGLSVEDDVYDVVHPPGYETPDGTVGLANDIVTTVAMPVVSAADEDESGQPDHQETQPVAVMSTGESDDDQDGDRSYANLFSRLRRLQIAAREMDDRF